MIYNAIFSFKSFLSKPLTFDTNNDIISKRQICKISSRCSEVGIAPVSGTGDRGFESRHFDQKRAEGLSGSLLFF